MFVQSLQDNLTKLAVSPSSRLMLAVSGGADSVALLTAAVQLPQRSRDSLVVAHFDHRLRGEESTADATWVVSLAEQLKIAYRLGQSQPSDFSGATRIEETARRLRYDFLREAAEKTGCEFLVTAHTADDQAETVLHHIIRGTGLSGVRGIPARRALTPNLTLVRPFLRTTRSEVIEWLAGLGQSYRTDSSNQHEGFLRNRIRHRVLPLLREAIHPLASQHLCRLAEQAAEWEIAMKDLALTALKASLLEQAPRHCRLATQPLLDLPEILVAEVGRTLWQQQGWPISAMNRRAWMRWVALTRSPGIIELPGAIRVEATKTHLWIQAPHASS